MTVGTHSVAVTRGPRQLEVTTRPVEALGDDDVLVEVGLVGICGTDLHIYRGHYSLTFPVVQGHEIAGRVDAVAGGREHPLRPGDAVAIEPSFRCGICYPCTHGSTACERFASLGVHRDGGLQQFLRVPAAHCHPAPGLPLEVAVLAEPLSVSLRALDRAGVSSGEVVLVLGCGAIGLLAALAASDRGARVLAVDPQPNRRAVARQVGAEEVVASVDEAHEVLARWTGGGGAGVVVEAVGAPALAEAAVRLVAVGGRIVVVGVSEESMSLDLRAVTRKEITLVGTLSTFNFPDAVALLSRRASDVTGIVTREYDLGAAGDALDFTLDNPGSTIKTVVRVAHE